MTLDDLMRRVGATGAEVARATGLHPATVSRVRRGEQVPDGVTLLRLTTWAEAAARKARIKTRLSWAHLDDARGVA